MLVTVFKLPANCVVARPPECTSRAAPPASTIRHKEPALPRIVTTTARRWEDVCPSQSQAQRKCSPHCHETPKHKRLHSHVQASSASTACSVSQQQYIPSGHEITQDDRPDSSPPVIRLVLSSICSLHCCSRPRRHRLDRPTLQSHDRHHHRRTDPQLFIGMPTTRATTPSLKTDTVAIATPSRSVLNDSAALALLDKIRQVRQNEIARQSNHIPKPRPEAEDNCWDGSRWRLKFALDSESAWSVAFSVESYGHGIGDNTA